MKEQETKLCKHCQTEIPKKAKVCPNCRRKQGGKLKWILIAAIAVFIIGSIASGGGESKENNGGSTSTKEKSEVEYTEITSSELIDAYKENQVKCKQDYDGKDLKVTGTVTSVGTDILDDVYVCLGHDSELTFVGIQCYAKDENTENEIAELKEGDVITVVGKGECGSLSFSIRNAEIIK